MKNTIALFIGVICLLTSSAFAAPQTCTVPVCDIPALVQELRSKPEIERFNYTQNLITNHERSKDVASLQNLVDAALAIKNLSIELKDEDYVAKSCDQLVNIATIGLSKYDYSDQLRMVSYYKQISNIDDRYRVLDYWVQKIQDINDKAHIERLAYLGQEALKVEKEWDGTRFQYVPDQARQVIRLSIGRITTLDPYNEGVFEVVLQGIKGRDIFYHLVTMQSRTDGSGSGLDIYLIPANSEDTSLFTFPDTGYTLAYYNDHAHMWGISNSPFYRGAPATITVDFYTADGRVNGILRNTQQGKDIPFNGTQKRSLAEFFRMPAPVPVVLGKEVEGEYRGTIGDFPGTVILKQLSPREWGASFKSDNNQFSQDLMHGQFFESKGVLTFFAYANEQQLGRVAFSVRKKQNSSGNLVNVLDGFEYLTRNGDVLPLKMEKVGDVDPYKDPNATTANFLNYLNLR